MLQNNNNTQKLLLYQNMYYLKFSRYDSTDKKGKVRMCILQEEDCRFSGTVSPFSFSTFQYDVKLPSSKSRIRVSDQCLLFIDTNSNKQATVILY